MGNFNFSKKNKPAPENQTANSPSVQNEQVATDNPSGDATVLDNTSDKNKKAPKKPLFQKNPKNEAANVNDENFVERRRNTTRVGSPIFEFKAPDRSKNEFDYPVPDNADFDYDWDGENLIPLNPNAAAVVIPQAAPASQTVQNSSPYPNNTEKKKNNSVFMTPIFWILTLFGVAIIVGITVASTYLPKRVNPRDIVDVKFEGVEGYGTCVISFDEERIKKYLPKQYNALIKSEYYSDYTNDWSVPYYELDIDTSSDLYSILSYITITIDPEYELSNGDHVEITFDYDNDILSEEYNVRFVGENYTETVNGLGNGTSINPFDDYHISYEGINGLGVATGSYTGPTDYFDKTDFVLDQEDNLSNGDTITVTLYYDEQELFENGLVVVQSSKTFTVNGLASYAESFESLSDDFVVKLKADAQDTITSYAEESYKDLYSLGELEYCGNAMGTIIIPDPDMNSNILYMVYKSVLSPVEEQAEASSETKDKDKNKNKNNSTTNDGEDNTDSADSSNVEVYYPVMFSNIKPTDTGFEYEGTPEIQGEFTLPDGTSSKGYSDSYNCYFELIDTNTSDYEMVANDGFDQFAEIENAEESESDISDTDAEADTASGANDNSTSSKNKTDSSSSTSTTNNSTSEKTSSDSSSSSSSDRVASTDTTSASEDESAKPLEITSIDDLSVDFLTELEDAALVTVDDYVNIDYTDKLDVLSSPSICGEYFLHSKNNKDDNIVYCVYYVTVQTFDEDSESFDIYFPVKFTGITGDSEGNFKYANNEGILGMSDIPNLSNSSTKGFIKESAMYKEVKNSNYNLELYGNLTDDFSYEDN